MRLSKKVTEKDVEEAIHLLKVATLHAATDRETGLIDMDIIQTGKSAHYKTKVDKITVKIKLLLKANVQKYQKSSTVEGLMV